MSNYGSANILILIDDYYQRALLEISLSVEVFLHLRP